MCLVSEEAPAQASALLNKQHKAFYAIAKHRLRGYPFSMALGASVASRYCAVGFVARFDILGLVWRYDRVRVGFVRHVDSLNLISTSVNLRFRCL